MSGAKSYVIEQSTDAGTANSWKHTAAARSSQTISGLTSGTRYWFRVAAINALGQSGCSDPDGEDCALVSEARA